MDLSVWYLVGAVLVFFMQCGFAMVEAGFTRAKNAGNIIMKNLMDFCIGTVVFILLGYGIMNSENYFFGLIGKPEYQMFTDFYGFDWSNFFFQLVFCATAATIVSGAMAERTKFLAYCVYSGVISAVIYPIEAGWVWNGQGWLVGLGYVDFAGSSVIHMVGGLSALVGAWMLGPRLGKYTREKDGTLRVNAIPGHSLTLGALGCFILWFCWYGFNGGAAADTAQLAQILGNTTLAPAVATFVCMVFTWKRGGKPDASMCLNASLAGLVGITAPGALGGDVAYEPVDVEDLAPVTLAGAPAAGHPQGGMTKLTIICREERFSALREAMAAIGVTGMTVSRVMGCGAQMGKVGQYRGVKMSMHLLPKLQVDIVVAKVDPALVVAAAEQVLRTGNQGDGKIFLTHVDNAVKVRTGEMDYDALQDD
ncbi:ammonium transporter [Pseudoflavonifractor phocaeensis]|uniref:ammonium transporter n=1 Tax=Pseudoflavonifractor phocaeensis TaxID=1870988 RepID=UPI00195B9AD2|nr:P-II family nitrogen regulator [Pseudoflavonifractor phocaeensis]MBM6724068.1 hypothetical protein [Pseudoflavonifractor phocaeensis]